MGIAHLAFDFCSWNKGCYGVDNDEIEGAGTNQHIHDFERLFTGIWLGNKKGINIHSEFLGIFSIECMLCIDKCCDTASFLGVGNRVKCERCLS